MPQITVATSLATSVICAGSALLAVYSGLFNEEVWQVLLCLYFLAILPVSGWLFRPKRRQT